MSVLKIILFEVAFLATVITAGSILFGAEERNALVVLFGTVATFGCAGWFLFLVVLFFR